MRSALKLNYSHWVSSSENSLVEDLYVGGLVTMDVHCIRESHMVEIMLRFTYTSSCSSYISHLLISTAANS